MAEHLWSVVTVLDIGARVINNSDKAALLAEFTLQWETTKKQNAIPNKVRRDCDKCYKGKRVDIVTDAHPVSREAFHTWSDRDGLLKEVTCELTPQMWKERNHMTSRWSRPGRGYWARNGLQCSPNETVTPTHSTYLTGLSCRLQEMRQCMQNVFTLRLAPGQHMRNVTCYYSF